MWLPLQSPFAREDSNTMIATSRLDNHALLRTQSIDDFGDCMSKLYIEPKLAFSPKAHEFSVNINSCRLSNITLTYADYRAAMQLAFPAADKYLYLIPIRGMGEISVGRNTAIATPNDGVIISPDCGYRSTYDTDREMLGLTIDAQALTTKFSALTGIHIDKAVHIQLQKICNAAVVSALREYIAIMVETIGAANAPLPRWWITEAEELVMTMLLSGYRHDYSHLLENWQPKSVGERRIRRLEEYIEENWQEPVNLENIAEVSESSAIDLYDTFQKTRGYSLQEFVAKIRSKRKGRPH